MSSFFHPGFQFSEFLNSLRYVIANDLSPGAVDAIKRNVEINGLGGISGEVVTAKADTKTVVAEAGSSGTASSAKNGSAPPSTRILHTLKPKVRINEGDAWYVISLNVLSEETVLSFG